MVVDAVTERQAVADSRIERKSPSCERLCVAW
jgi:hypothetical protein